jgi:hypothetical protein
LHRRNKQSSQQGPVNPHRSVGEHRRGDDGRRKEVLSPFPHWPAIRHPNSIFLARRKRHHCLQSIRYRLPVAIDRAGGSRRDDVLRKNTYQAVFEDGSGPGAGDKPDRRSRSW